MKILIQNSVFFPNLVGGTELSSYLLARSLDRRGIEVDALATTGKRSGRSTLEVRPLEGTRGQVYESTSAGLYDLFPGPGPRGKAELLLRGLHHVSAVHSARWFKLAREAIDRSAPDVLHTNNLVGMTPAVWRAAKERNIPVVHTLRDLHLLCPRTTLLRSDHTECVDPPLPCRLLSRMKLSRTGLVDVVTAPSKFTLQLHLDHGGFSDARPVVVANACEEEAPQRPDRTGRSRVVGVYLGRLDAYKGVAVLLESLAALDSRLSPVSFGFEFAGEGGLAEEVARFCERDRDRFRYHGQIAGEEKRALLRRADFLVVPSICSESFGRTTLDAFSYGIPVIGSNRGGIPEVVRDDREGVLIEPEPRALADAMTGYFTDERLRLRHGDAAFERAADFTLSRQVDRFLEIYRSLEDRAGTG